MLKHNYVIILRDGAKDFTKAKSLSSTKPFIEYDDNGNFCVIGTFMEEDIKDYEYYSVKDDWQTLSGFRDRPL